MKTNKDYKDDLKQALIELDEPVEKRHRDKENDFLNVILGILIVLIVVVGIAGAVMIGKTYVNLDPKDPVVNNDPVINNNEQDNNQLDEDHDIVVDDDTNNQDIINSNDNNQDIEKGFIHFTNEENGDFKVIEFKVSKEDDKVRFDIESETTIAGNIFLMDDKTLSIGPISIDAGNNNLYFLINGQNNYELHFDASNGREYIYEISKEDIRNALEE